MKKRSEDCNITHVLADGRVMTNEQFMAQPFKVDRSNNEEFFSNAEIALNINFISPRNLGKHKEYVAERRIELEAELHKIRKELEAL